MSGLSLLFRRVAHPVWLLRAARTRVLERGAPLLELRIGPRHPAPDPRAVRAVAQSGVAGLWLRVETVRGAGWASLQELRGALDVVRAAGKQVFVELEHCGNGELYLGTAATRVWIRPMTSVDVLGVAATLRFAGDALARVGLRFDVEAAGAYKSFGETFTRGWASPENREAVRTIVEDLQGQLEQGIAAGRGLDVEAVRSAVAAAPLSAEDAIARGLVDAAAYADQVETELEERLGKDFARRDFVRWWKRTDARLRIEAWMAGLPRVAVVHLRGSVVEGDGSPGSPSIAANPVVERLDELAEDDSVRAVVLSIRSPGGSATASDLIWRAVVRLRERKPVVAAFGDVAASGGYYIAAPCNQILVQPGTLTGSIGVVGGKLVLGPALARVGVHTEQLTAAPAATMYTPDAPFDPVQRQRFRDGLTRFYRAFVERVAAGRARPFDEVEPLARGRVWTGARAVAIGLADAVGSVDDAVARAAGLVGVPVGRRVDIRVGPAEPVLMKLLRRFGGRGADALLGALAAAERGPLALAVGSLPDPARMLATHPGTPLAVCGVDVDAGP
jgi:protease-4